MQNRETVDIIFVNYNSTDCLMASIKSVLRYKTEAYRVTITVVDNASTDGVRRIKNRFPFVHVICNPINVGFGAAINQALKRSHSRYVILLNPDSIVFSKFLPTSIDYMETYPEVGIIGPMIMDEEGRDPRFRQIFSNAADLFFRPQFTHHQDVSQQLHHAGQYPDDPNRSNHPHVGRLGFRCLYGGSP